MSGWTGLDFFIFLIFMVNILLGMARGGLKEMISVFSLCIALVITIKFTVPITKFVNSSPLMTDVITSHFFQNFAQAIEMPPLTEATLVQVGYCVSLLICFVATFSVCEGALFYTSVMEAFGFSMTIVNRKAGAALGAMRGFVVVLVFIIVLEHLFAGNVPTSGFINLFQSSAKKLDELISAGAPERYLEILQDKNLYNQAAVLKDLLQPN